MADPELSVEGLAAKHFVLREARSTPSLLRMMIRPSPTCAASVGIGIGVDQTCSTFWQRY